MLNYKISEKLFANVCKAESLDSCEKIHIESMANCGLSGSSYANMIDFDSRLEFFKENREDIMKYFLSIFEFSTFVKWLNKKNKTKFDSNEILDILLFNKVEEYENAIYVIGIIVSLLVSRVCSEVLEKSSK